jgi:hypothetical protein
MIIGEFDMFLRIHLPGLVRHSRAVHVDDRTATGGRGGQVMLDERPLERTHGGDDFPGQHLQQLNPDETGTPGRVLASQLHGRLDRAGWFDRGDGGGMVGGLDPPLTERTESCQQPTDGRRNEPQRGGDLTRLATALPEPKRSQTDWNGGGAGHGSSSGK